MPYIPSSPLSMKSFFTKKKKNTKPSPLACESCRSRKVACHAPHGIGTPCKACTKASRPCEWSRTLEQGLTTARRFKGPRSCIQCQSRRMGCSQPAAIHEPCGTCLRDNMSCSFAEVIAPIHDGQVVAGPSKQVPGHNFGGHDADGAYGHSPSLAIDTSMTVADRGESITPSSGPSSPRSYWDTVLNQEYSAE